MNDPITTYELWQHAISRERWLVRLESTGITGIYGPVPAGERPVDPEALPFEDHPDELEWFFRTVDNFRVVAR
jgi:hypothetical protein